ncbi:MAG: RES family NAD+ phosphorylase [Bdellovibrionaceae bacterium]|nr:RES family NAD+ phosphorylase [Pseudobdellovibrionaceae bacterium]
MSHFNHIWTRYGRSKQTPEDYVEKYLTKLEKFDSARLEFEQKFQSFLAQEREKRLERILDALSSSGRSGFEGICYRIVSSEYGDDPLCTFGSLVDSGRFNFGSIGSYFSQFDCHYVASDFETAFQEKFHYSTQDLKGTLLSPEEMMLGRPPSFNNVRVEVSLSRCLDLRDPDSLKSFFDVIAEISPSESIQWDWEKWCTKFKQDYIPRATVQEIEQLYFSIYDPNFKQFETYLDIPSNSQWIGHYARQAGIQAVIYLSVRNETGYNLAIFPTNLRESDSYIRLMDGASYVDPSRRHMNSDNCEFFKCTFKELRSQGAVKN